MSQTKNRATLGVDIGGTHLSVALVDRDTMQIISGSESRSDYDHTSEANVIFKIWANTISESLKKVTDKMTLEGVGFAMPGPFDYKSGTSKMEQKLVSIHSMHIPTELHKLLDVEEKLEMRFLNDATCFAIGESLKTQSGQKKVVAITLGTGFGSAFLDSGIPIVQRADVPAEGCLWHLPFLQGIADNYFSTSWFTKYYQEVFAEEISGVKEIVDTAPKENIAQVFEQFSQNLSQFIGPYLKQFGAEVLIIGGNISKALPYFEHRFTELLRSQGLETLVRPSELLENAAIIGAAELLNDENWSEIYKTIPSI